MSEEKKKKKNGSAPSGKSGSAPAERKKTDKTAPAKSKGGKSSREKTPEKTAEPRTGYPDRLPSDGMLHQFMPYILVVAAVFLTACFIFSTVDGAMGVVGKTLRDVLCGLLGWPAFFLPLIILNLAIYWRRYVDRGLVGWKLLLSFVTIVFISSLVHVFYVSRAHQAYGWSEYWNSVTGSGGFASNWTLGVGIKGGGFLGGFAGGFFNCTVGFVGSTILLIALIIVSVMFLFSVTPGYVLTSIKYRIKKHREKREKRLEENEERTRRAEEAERAARERREREREQAEEAAGSKKKKKEREFFADAVVTDGPDGKIADSPKVLGTVESIPSDKRTGTRSGPAAVVLNSSPGMENSLPVITGQTKAAPKAAPDPAPSAAGSVAGTSGSGKRDPALQSTYEVLDRIFGEHPKGNKSKAAVTGGADAAVSGTAGTPAATLQPGTASKPGPAVTPSGTRTPRTTAGDSRSIPVVKAEMTPTHVTDPDPEEDSAVT
ncbi:MAG: hypothetical protein ILO42_08565, partial [Clostridia bacterium]|nr:hypothetical protein [Clostridia bacterium]